MSPSNLFYSIRTYQVTLTPQAQTDLREIFKYIAIDLQSIQNATGQLDRLEKAIAFLDQIPEQYRIYDKPKWRERNLRILPVDNYLVFYISNHDDETVTVIRIMYGDRDIDKQLKNPE